MKPHGQGATPLQGSPLGHRTGFRAPAGAVRVLLTPLCIALVAWNAVGHPSEDAHLYSGIYFPAPADLELERAEELKADAMAHYIVGNLLEEEGENLRALERYQKALDLDPSHVELARRVAETRVRRGEIYLAINLLKDTIEAVPEESALYVDLARIYAVHQQRPETAFEFARKALDIDPGHFPTYQTLFGLYLTQDDFGAAEEVLDRAMTVESEEQEFWIQLAALYSQYFARQRIIDDEDALQSLEEVYLRGLDQTQNAPAILSQLADFYILSDRFEEAIPLYEAILEQEAVPFSAGDPADFTNVREKLARAYRVMGRKQDAIGMLEALIRKEPLRHSAYELLGDLLEQEEEYLRAALQFEQSLLLNPNQAHMYLRAAELFLHPGSDRADKAVELLLRGRERFPDRPELTYFLAISLREAGQYPDAMLMFENAVYEAQRHAEELLNAVFYFQYGATAERAKLYKRAAELFRKSIELDPSFAAAYNYLGYMWVDRDENLEEAGELIRHALSLDPYNGAYLDSLGWYYFRQGEFEKALAELLKAVEHLPSDDPEYYVVYDHIADTYLELGEPGQAILYWEKAIRMNPDADGISEKIKDTKQQVTATQE